MKTEFLTLTQTTEKLTLNALGIWRLKNISHIEKELRSIDQNSFATIVWDVSQIEDFDSAGVLLFQQYFQIASSPKVEGYSQKQYEMYQLLTRDDENIITPKKEGILGKWGKKTVENLTEMMAFITFLGQLSYTFFHAIFHPKEIRFKEIVYHIHQSGLNALVIIGLTSFLVGMVISYQGAVQLAKFGADIFIVDTVAISITRELGPMITAIVIAGRSGSAYTAEIGAMKITEEISAMRTMGFDPYHFLVLPRVFALIIALPLLIFFADMMGIMGGMVASNMELGISFTQFTDRLYEVLDVKHYLLGMLKAPVFAFLIASVGCFRGLQVSNNTESIGLHTTASVVNGIFLVILFDALFSVLFTRLGI